MRLGLAPAVAIVAAATAVVATGCGASPLSADSPAGRAPPPAGEQAPNADRMPDLVPLTKAQVAHRAKRIAVVVSLGSRVVEGAPGTPFTRTTFRVERVLKGHLKRRFVLRVIGGRLGDVVVDSLVPAFARSRRYILFLGPDGPVGPTIFPQAVFSVKPGRLDRMLTRVRRYL